MSSQVFLALGSNLGQRRENLQRAVEALGRIVAIDALSPVYDTEPWGVTDQPTYLNSCLAATTDLLPSALLDACKSIEIELGREPGPKWGPRLIDIDLLYFDDLVIDDGRLIIPHPRLSERAFVLVPLADIAPSFVDPLTGQTISELLAQVDSSGVEIPADPRRRLRMPSFFAWGPRSYVMGIINVTPDSFSGDGVMGRDDWLASAVARGKALAAAGADILDVGGESTRPGSRPIAVEEELARALPVIGALRQEVDIPISIDTYRAGVARKALEAGANWVNDVWGLRMDPEMVDLVAEAGCPLVIMHNRSRPKNVHQQEVLGGRFVGVDYKDLISDVRRELQESIDKALAGGVKPKQIIIDPGIGFGKTVSQNALLLNELNKIKEMGYPLLVGPSRKSFIGYTLNLPVEERLEGTAAAVAIAIDRGADVVRVHDVGAMVRVARMTDRIIGK